jgi:polysaccharide biosynthesis/export protein
MAFGSHKMLSAVVVLVAFASGCGSVSQDPAAMAQRAAENAARATAPNTAAEINRSIAAAASQHTGATADYRIGPEDLLEITLFNVPEAHGMERQVTPRLTTVRVSHQGHISLPVVGDVETKGLTVSALEERLRQRYDKYIHNPQVGVLVREFRQRTSVMGAVHKPGVYELTGPKSVIDVLAMAGGVTDRAGSQVHVYRDGPQGRESHVIDLAVLATNTGLINASNAPMINMPVEPGDLVNVPMAGTYFVDGAVRNPGSYPLGRQYSLSQALATAGGVNFELNSNDITIFRRQGPGKVESIALNLTDVMAGTTPDPEIHPDDVIVVPVSGGKYFVRRFIGTLIGGMSIGSFVPKP